jgi:hypothetical protein
MVKTEANPAGLPKAVFDGFQEQLAANRAQFYYDVPAGPFYGYNRPGAKPSQAVIWNWWRQGMMGCAKAHYDGIVAFSQTVHWNRVPSEGNDKVLVDAFPGAQSFVVQSAVNVQFMVKDSKKYAATGGWGFGDFKDARPGDEVLHKACFGCHVPDKVHDYVFAHYAPLP